jgi:hypothetical protein
MIEKKQPAYPVFIRAMCACGGEMKFTGSVLTTYPAQYPHRCSRCAAVEKLGRRYPDVSFDLTPPT